MRPGGESGVQVTVQEVSPNQQSQECITLAAPGAARLSDRREAGSCHQVRQPPFFRGKGRRPREDAAGDSRPHGGAAGSVEAAKPALYIFGPLPGHGQHFGLAPIPMNRAPGGDEDRRDKEVVLRSMHLDRGISHERIGKPDGVRVAAGPAGLLDQIQRRQPVTAVADEVPLCASCMGSCRGAAESAGKVMGLFTVDKLRTAKKAAGTVICPPAHANILR